MLQDIKEMHQTRFMFKEISCRLSKIGLGTEDIILCHMMRFCSAKHGRREGCVSDTVERKETEQA